MKQFFLILMLLAGLGSSISSAQTICISHDGKPCPPALEMRWCADEKVSPNLSIAKTVKLSGVLLDETGASIIFEKTSVQVKDPKTDKVMFSAELDARGQFDLGIVPAGDFRFLVVWLKDGKLRRLPLADQPKNLFCSTEMECDLRISIHFHGTDNPIDFCPPK